MRTQAPFSFVSWNTESFLRDTLDMLLAKGDIDFYAYIYHKAEEEQLKDHFHVFCMPSHCVDTDVIKPKFDQVDPANALPIKIVRITKSVWYDWYWYALHDPRYLATKSLEPKKYIYSKDKVVVSSKDYFQQLVCCTPCPKNPAQDLIDAICNDVSFVDLLATGIIPIHQVKAYELAYRELFRVYNPTRSEHSAKRQVEMSFVRNTDYYN